MDVLVMGAGAIGCFVGGMLASAGHQVTLLGRPALMQQLAAQGLGLRWPGRPLQTVFPKTATAVAELSCLYDVVFLTVKTPDAGPAIQQLTALPLEPPTRPRFVSLQNGIGTEEQLVQAFGRPQIIAGTITLPIQMPKPGLIEVSKRKGGLGLAALEPSPAVKHLARALNQTGLTADTYYDYRAMKWSKLLLNIINNASSAILNQPPAQIISQTELFDLEIRALQEGVAVMKGLGLTAVKLPGYPVDWLAWLVSARWLPLGAMRAILRPFMRNGRGTKMPSLQIDLAAGRSTSEIGALNGAIVQAGQRLGIATPVNQALTSILSGLVAGDLAWHDYQNQPAKLIEAAKQSYRR